MVHARGDIGKARHALAAGPDRHGLALDLCPEWTWDSELVESVAGTVRDEREVVEKKRAIAFHGTSLEADLRTAGVQLIVVVGTTTSYCVDSSIRDAYARDFGIVVQSDAVADTHDADQRASLRSIERSHGLVTTTDDVLSVWGEDGLV